MVKHKGITVLQKKRCKNYCISTLYLSLYISFKGNADTFAKIPLFNTIIYDILHKC